MITERKNWRLQCGTVAALFFTIISSVSGDSTLDNPIKNDSYCPDATIAGTGTGPSNVSFVVHVKINGISENSKSENTSPHDTWQCDVPAPTSDWTITNNAQYELWYGGAKQVSEKVQIVDCGGGPA